MKGSDWRDDPELVALRDAIVEAICSKVWGPGTVPPTPEELARNHMEVLCDSRRFIRPSSSTGTRRRPNR